MGKNHVRILKDLPNVDLVGIHDIDNQEIRDYADQQGVTFCGEIEDLFERSDALVIAVPTDLHFAFTKDALEHGLDVLVEKPITETLEQARHLCEIAKTNHKILQVGHVERFNPVCIELPNFVKDPILFSCERLSPFTPSWVGETGVILDLMIHDLDIVASLVHSDVLRINALCTSRVTDTEDLAIAQIAFTDGTLANFTASRVSQAKIRRFTITQPDEYIYADLLRTNIAIHHYVSSDYFFDRRMGFKQETVTEIPYLSRHGEPLRLELESFVDCVVSREKPKVSGEDGLRALALASKVMEACAVNK
jgi:predicted dehydrogenase